MSALGVVLAATGRARIALVVTARGFLVGNAQEGLPRFRDYEASVGIPPGLLHREGAPRQGRVFWQRAQMNVGR